MTKVDLSGLDNMMRRIAMLGTLNMTPLMKTWGDIIQKDNKRGILAGLDKNGLPMRPVTYRPVGKVAKLTAKQRNATNPRKRASVFGGFGNLPAGLNNNLSSSEYRKLDGPPLAPRKEYSRVITNLLPGVIEGMPGERVWMVTCTWADVVSKKGVSFLPYHFNGSTNLPARDLRGVRPEGLAEARKVAINFLRDQIRAAPVGTFNAA